MQTSLITSSLTLLFLISLKAVAAGVLKSTEVIKTPEVDGSILEKESGFQAPEFTINKEIADGTEKQEEKEIGAHKVSNEPVDIRDGKVMGSTNMVKTDESPVIVRKKLPIGCGCPARQPGSKTVYLKPAEPHRYTIHLNGHETAQKGRLE